jgi:hypothetical protein
MNKFMGYNESSAKFIALSCSKKKLESSHTSNLKVNWKSLESKQASKQTNKQGSKPNKSRRQEIIKIRAETSWKLRKQYKESVKPRSRSLRKSTR